MVPDRTDSFIFGQVGYTFFANMILNVLWLLVFVRDNKWAFMFSTIINFALLYTCVFIMMISCRTELNMFEAIVIRTCFSLYAGWVTAACVLNVFFTLKSWNKSSISDDDFKNVEEEAEKAESYLTVKALWIVVIIYTAFSFEE